MLMKCSKCGYENQLNAIFCRGCGEKLNPSEVSPEELEKEAKKRKKAGKKIKWGPIVGLLLLAGVVTYAILLFTSPADAPVYNKEAEVPYEATLKSIESNYSATVSPEQITAFFNESLLDKGAAKKNADYSIKDVVFTGKGDKLTITIHTTVLTCATTISVTGQLKKGPDEKPILFDITGFRFGNTTLPYGREFILKKFDNVFYAEQLQTIFRNAQDVVFTDGNLVITQKKEEKKQASRNKKKAKNKK